MKREKLLHLAQRCAYLTEEQKQWLKQPDEDDIPIFERVYNDYSCLRLNPNLLDKESEFVREILNAMNEYYEDEPWTELQLKLLAELILNRDLYITERQYVTEAANLWNLGLLKYGDLKDIITNNVCAETAEKEYACLVPAQLVLYLMNESRETLLQFWNKLAYIMTDMITVANIVQEHARQRRVSLN